MGLIPRSLSEAIGNKLQTSNKIVILYGARQTGKTTLVSALLQNLPYRTLAINADELRYVDVLSSRNFNALKGLVSGYELLFIDEAQRVADIGINLKILHDGIPALRIVVTGSSSLELASRTKEPLTGRTWTHILYPISVLELYSLYNPFELQELTEKLLVYGSYPEIFSIENDATKGEYLREVCSSYLYKDILLLSGIKNKHKIVDLLRMLAYQIGSQISIHELGRQLGMSRDTVESYIDLLEKTFVIFRLRGFSRNLRKELSKSNKIYFYDLGIRNSLIENLKPLKHRDDVGKLWENFLVIERKKTLAYSARYANTFFWRTYTGAELDYVEEQGGDLRGYEIKYGAAKARAPKTWMETYPRASWELINGDNYLGFLLPPETLSE